MHNLELVGASQRHRDMKPPTDHTGGEIGVQNRGHLAAQNEPKSKLSPMVYLHAGSEIGSGIPYGINCEPNED